ncbi:MAG: anthranilate phosphoribosyltransferase [Candidatus Omnitrophota bacterium]|nr:anthranilate phosphoribosyltransferase [Candidatus Omnitrophota bacterium]
MDRILDITCSLTKGVLPSRSQIKYVFSDIMSGKVETEGLKKFLLALKDKETPEIIAGAAEAMREKMIRVNVRVSPDEIVLDTCGTGGSSFHTFNISTAAAFVIGGCGIKVAKHGNRAVSSQFGSADVLKELGLNLETPPRRVEEIIKEIGIGFLFAPMYHPAMKYAVQARKELATRTIFNILGPLCNPAGADVQVIGVYEEKLTEIMAKALGELESRRAFILYSEKGLDELSIEGKTKVVELIDKKISHPLRQIQINYLRPQDFGLSEGNLSGLLPGKDAKENAKIILNILNGEKSSRADAVLINAALGIVAVGVSDNFKDAVKIARESIFSGNAFKKFEALKEQSNK